MLGLGQVAENRREGKIWVRAFLGVSTRKVRKVRVKGLVLASLNNSRGLQAVGVVSCGLVSGPGGISGREIWACYVREKEVIRAIDSGLAGCYIGDVLPARLFTTSKNWLALGGHLSLGL